MTAQALGPFLSPVGMRPVPHCSGCDKPSPGRSRFAVLAECPRKASWPDGHTLLAFLHRARPDTGPKKTARRIARSGDCIRGDEAIQMEIKVIGTGCDKCDLLYENTQEALRNLGMEANVEKVEDLVEIVKLGVMTSPSLMVDGKLVISGREAKTREIEKLLSR